MSVGDLDRRGEGGGNARGRQQLQWTNANARIDAKLGAINDPVEVLIARGGEGGREGGADDVIGYTDYGNPLPALSTSVPRRSRLLIAITRLRRQNDYPVKRGA